MKRASAIVQPKQRGIVPGFFANLGPGLVTGAADDDPSGISTYSVAGAAFGYSFLWTALFSFPLMATVQLMCARLGMVTGRGSDPLAVFTVGTMASVPAAERRERVQYRRGSEAWPMRCRW